ncbi:MAG: adenylate/guanylate cyclase domain-containing protein [Bacteroidia bacterium]
MEQGLSSNKVNCIFQDKKGFMWFGTDYGLNRYDGYNFKVFLKNENDSLSLSDNDIECLTQDAKGNIWIGTPKGLNVMDYKTEKIIPFVAKKNKTDSLFKYKITALAADSEGNVWIGTRNKGLFNFNINDNQSLKYLKAENDTGTKYYFKRWLNVATEVTCISIDRNGNVWAGSRTHGVFQINKKTGKMNRIPLNEKFLIENGNNVRFQSNNNVNTIFADSHNDIYIGTQSSNTLYNNDTDKISHAEVFFGNLTIKRSEQNEAIEIKDLITWDFFFGINAIVEYSPRVLLLCSYGNKLVTLTVDSASQNIFRSNELQKGFKAQIKQIFKDNKGGFWFATDNGIETLNSNKFKLKMINSKINKCNCINSLLEDRNDNIWVGKSESILIMEKNKNELIPVVEKSEQNKGRFSICLSDSNEIIYGTKWKDIFSYNHKSNEYKIVLNLGKESIPGVMDFNFIRAFGGGNGSLWAISDSGIGEINFISAGINYLVPIDTIKENHQEVYTDEHKGNFWLMNSFQQIIKLNYLERVYKIFDIRNKWKLDEDGVNALALDENGILWIASDSKGLVAFNPINQKLYQFTLANGLPSNEIKVLVFSNDELWSTYRDGIYKFIPPKNIDDSTQKPIIKIYGTKDGLPNIDFSTEAMIKTHDGKILFAADTTLISFYPDSIKSNDFIPPVVITSMQLNNKNIDPGDSTKILFNNIISTDTIHLKYNQNNLSLEFAALNYIHSEENEYAYKLEGDGADTAWIYCNKRRFVNFSNLSPGEYTFHVKACNNDGLWNETGTQLKIFITPPYWQTAWFKILCAIAVVLSVFGIYKWRTRALRADKRKLQHKVEERTAEIANQKIELENSFQNLEVINKIGSRITSSLDLNEIFNKLYEYINSVMDASGFTIYVFNPITGCLEGKHKIGIYQHISRNSISVNSETSFSAMTFNLGKVIWVNDFMNEYKNYNENITNYYKAKYIDNSHDGPIMKAFINVPFFYKEKVIGIINVYSLKEKAYTNGHVQILESLASFIAIALSNADSFHKLEASNIEIKNQKSEIEKEKQKSDELLLNILPAEVMEELKSTGKTQARNYDLVTVLFADFKDFTQIIEEMAPEELVSGIDHYFETFDKIIEKYPIEKIKTVGDAYICAAGLPQMSSNNPVIMMDAAFEMVQAIEQLKQERKQAGKIIFDVRIGAHSGPLVAGVVGIKKFAYDIWGDTVNTAARMQQYGEPGKINVSGTTYGLIKHRYQCEHRGRVEVKHKGEIDMYFVEKKK